MLEDAEVGDSVAVNGCCVTVVSFTEEIWETELTTETLERTTFGLLSPGDASQLGASRAGK